MEPELVSKESFWVLGVLKRVDSDQPGFFDDMWMKYFMPVEGLVRPYSLDQAYYGVFFHPDDRQTPLDYLAGMAVSDVPEGEGIAVPSGCNKLSLKQVPAARYAVYRCTFKDIGQASDFITGEWLPASPYEYDHPLPGFEYYPADAACSDSCVQIYIPVKSRAEQAS